MRNDTMINKATCPNALINPERLWAIEDELINIPLQFRDSFWNELLASYNHDTQKRK